MRQTKILLSASYYTTPKGLCRLSLVPAGRWPFPALSLLILPWVPGPLPRWLLWCTFPFLPIGHRPSPIVQRVGYQQHPHNGDFCVAFLSGLQSFLYVQAPRFARHSGRPTMYKQSGSDFYFRAEHPPVTRKVHRICLPSELGN